jgi:RNA polymerase sigma factor (sigma-70 family)
MEAAGGDQEARDRLVDAFMPLIGSVARHYRSTPAVDWSELMQEGVVGLLRALQRYDVQLGTPFWAYASWWVRQAMQQLVSELTKPVVLSDRALRQLSRVKRAWRDHVSEHRREPSTSELAAASGLPQEQVELLLAAERVPRGFEEPLDGEHEGFATVGDLFPDPVAQDDFAGALTRVEAEELRPLTDRLDSRERDIVFAHYGVGGPVQTLRQVANGLGLSVERVRQLEERALAKLRDAIENGEVTGAPSLRELSPAADPSELRERLGAALSAENVPDPDANDMLIAASEVAACVWREGGRLDAVRLGHIGGRLVCEVCDRGTGFNGKSRLGLGIARRLTRRMEDFTSPVGHTVRLWL